MSMHELLSIIGAQTERQAKRYLQFADGVVEEWFPESGTITARIKGPENDVLTGDIEFLQPFVGPEGSGVQGGPEKGMPVLIIAMDPDWEYLKAIPGGYNDLWPSPGVPRGDWWIVHKIKETYVKLVTEGSRLLLGGKDYIKVTAPKTDISDTLDDLGDDNRIVRWKDLKAVVDRVNALQSAYKGHGHIGNMGAPTPFDPATIATNAALQDAVANGSTIGRVK